jgi:capsular polysaccharide biosynthesis protein
MAELGRSLGALTIREIAEIESRNRLPEWLLQKLNLVSSFPQSTSFEASTVFKGRKYRCRPPQVLGADSVPSAFQRSFGQSPDVSVISGYNARFLLQNFLQTAFLDDGYIPPMTDTTRLWGWQLVEGRRFPRLNGRTLLCVVEGSSIYTHWLLDTLPRLEVLRQYGLDFQRIDNIVFAVASADFCRESFLVLRIDQRKVVTRQKLGMLISCDEFVHVTTVRDQFIADGWLYEFVNRSFKPRVNGKRQRRIYISRSRAGKRRLLNESRLYPILERYGFEVVRAEELGIAGMAALCGDASHVVAPHGAGLSNLVFAPKGTIVLELYGPHLSSEYWLICNQLGHQYFCLQGTANDGRRFTQECLDLMTYLQRQGGDFIIDEAQLTKALSSILSA